ncbi:MAG: Rpn family recombination-promoting nuclease/putative transposase [Bacteroidales bacterium]|jgi:predicted transposase/invertase (TIGR01784 family)|nr:Rpn family recombination-promoting nuclease/putative transposase [Bacteroidales bacterium]
MARYLDPQHAIPFKRVFGEHPELLRSFLHALTPFPLGQQIKTLAYLSPEQAHEMPMGKHSIVDVKCVDNTGRHFMVEMQMRRNRMLSNVSTAYMRRLSKNQNCRLLQPVAIADDVYTLRKGQLSSSLPDVAIPAYEVAAPAYDVAVPAYDVAVRTQFY